MFSHQTVSSQMAPSHRRGFISPQGSLCLCFSAGGFLREAQTRNQKLFHDQKPVNVQELVTQVPWLRDKMKHQVQKHRAFSHFIQKMQYHTLHKRKQERTAKKKHEDLNCVKQYNETIHSRRSSITFNPCPARKSCGQVQSWAINRVHHYERLHSRYSYLIHSQCKRNRSVQLWCSLTIIEPGRSSSPSPESGLSRQQPTLTLSATEDVNTLLW